MVSKGVSVLKFVGTVSLGLLTGVSYTVSTLTLPTLLRLPSSATASFALTSLYHTLRTPVLTLTTLASAPLLLSFALSPRSARHPYLIYTSLLAVLSSAAPPLLLPSPSTRASTAGAAVKPTKKPASRPRMDASYEVLGDVHSEPASEEDMDDVNGEEVRVEVQAAARVYLARAVIAGIGFAMAVLGIWGDGAPQAVVYVS